MATTTFLSTCYKTLTASMECSIFARNYCPFRQMPRIRVTNSGAVKIKAGYAKRQISGKLSKRGVNVQDFTKRHGTMMRSNTPLTGTHVQQHQGPVWTTNVDVEKNPRTWQRSYDPCCQCELRRISRVKRWKRRGLRWCQSHHVQQVTVSTGSHSLMQRLCSAIGQALWEQPSTDDQQSQHGMQCLRHHHHSASTSIS